MNLIEKERQENGPYVQLLILVGYAILGVTVFSLIGFLIILGMYGLDSFSNPALLAGTDQKYRPAMQILLIATSLGMFLAPALFLALTERKKINRFYGFELPNPGLLGMVFLIMAVSMPFMEWIMTLNQKMVLPGFLKGVENWMREKEDAAMQTTLLLLKMNNVKDFLLNIFMIALVPAIAEELMFRGAVQRSFTRMFKNPHVAIWLSALIFSAIHVQFYGFFPRLLLGAGFGYIYLWSGNLWYAMFAHFLNNAYAVCAAWYMQKNNIPLSESDNTTYFAWYGYILSIVLTVIVFKIFKNQILKGHERQLD